MRNKKDYCRQDVGHWMQVSGNDYSMSYCIHKSFWRLFSKRMLLVIMVVAVMVNSSFVIRTESADSGDYSDSIVVSNFPGKCTSGGLH